MDRIAEKYKEKRPEDTVNFIRERLGKYGINVNETWYESGVEDCYSLRVQINGTEIGANGKGTTKEFARASGYAEFMERLENMLLYNGQTNLELIEKKGFWLAPDERQVTPEELALMDNPIVNSCLDAISAMKDGTVISRIEAAKRWKFNALGKTGYESTLIPFFSLRKRELVELPIMMQKYIYASNGMCAGNTPHEALIQGMCEIFERYVNRKVIEMKITPPEVPNEILTKYTSIYNIIKAIETKGNYKVIVKDCSLGEGYPVVASILINYDNQTYSVKFGAHPCFEIAVERTLTELFQGTNIASLSQENPFIWDNTSKKDNLANIIKKGSGSYPKEFFLTKGTFDLRDFYDEELLSNSELLEKNFKKLLLKGYDIYIRDVSYLDFPAYHIIIPGFSEVYPMDELRMREKNTIESVTRILKNIPSASVSELEKVIRIFRYKMQSEFENTLPFMMQLPISRNFVDVLFPETYLVAIISYFLGRDEIAFSIMSETVKVSEKVFKKGDPKVVFLRCLRDCIGSNIEGADLKITREVLSCFYPQEILFRAMDLVSDRDKILKKGFPVLACTDSTNCTNCNVKEYCSYEIIEDFLIKIAQAALDNKIDQMRLDNILPKYDLL